MHKRKLKESIKLDYCSDSLKAIKSLLDDIRKVYLGTRDMERFDRFEVDCEDDEQVKSIQQDLMAARGYIQKAEELLDDCYTDVEMFLDEYYG